VHPRSIVALAGVSDFRNLCVVELIQYVRMKRFHLSKVKLGGS
jgi:hypothetical protein